MSANFSDEAYRDAVKQNYGFTEWAGHTKEGDRNVRVSGFALPATDAANFEVEGKQDLTPASRQNRVTRFNCVSPPKSGNRIITTVFECKSVDDAHETLIDVVMTYMARKLPRCETTGLTIGDICFGSHGEVNLLVIFARFNILVEIKSATPGPTPVDEFARRIDALILDQFRTQAPR
jgi:hypothetical protein